MTGFLGISIACVVTFLVLAGLSATRRVGSGPSWGIAACLMVLTALGGLAWWNQRSEALETDRLVTSEVPHLGREPFVTSDTCRACHPSQYHSWHESFHRTMTQVASPEAVRAPWRGELESRGRRYRLLRKGDEFWADVVDPDWVRENRLAGRDVDFAPDPPRATLPVVMTTGSHHMQTYWIPSASGREVYNLPFVYLFDQQRWVPREDVFLRPPNAGRLVGLWNNTCIECHSTGPALGFDFAAEEFDSRVAEMGISCEACHGPAEEHVAFHRNPLNRYREHLDADGDPTIVQPERLDHELSSHVCGQCHGVWIAEDAEEWLREGHSFRPGDDLTDSRFLVRPGSDPDDPRLYELTAEYPDAIRSRFWSDGMVRVSGREMSGMIESPCFEPGEMSCLSCHSMHESDPNDQLARDMRTNQACLQCHETFSGEAALTAHTRHPLDSSGSQCMNCHMPHTTYGLLKAIRSHEIDSPRVAATVATGRPNACNLCHLDRSLGWTADHLRDGWGQPRPALSRDREEISAVLLDLLTGDAGQRALAAWHLGWEPARNASGHDWLAPWLGHLLYDPYAAVRYVAARSLETIPGWETTDYDYLAPEPVRAEARMHVIGRWLETHARPPQRTGRTVLADADGDLLLYEVDRLSRQRDDTPLSLEE